MSHVESEGYTLDAIIVKIILSNIDYHDIKGCYHICNNTLHKVYDQIEKELSLEIPLLFKVHLENEGLEVLVPNQEERAKVQIHQSKISKGEIENVQQ